VRVCENALLGERIGDGFLQIQARLGPGRLHHCARLVGHGERGIEELLRRGTVRRAFGKTLLELGGNMERLAQARVLVARSLLLVTAAAERLDAFHEAGEANHKMPRKLFAALAIVKLEVPRAMQECLDFAVQLHGGGGLSFDHPLAAMWTAARVLRLVIGIYRYL
jgi:acyl-CoA dehydrogenase